MSLKENKAVVQRLFEASNTRNLDILDEVIPKDMINHNPEPGNPQDVKQTYTRFVAAFPDVQFTVEDMVAEGDKVMVRLTVRGTHQGEFVGIPPTGKQITITGMEVLRIANGKVVERWANFDQLSFYQQLGVIQLFH